MSQLNPMKPLNKPVTVTLAGYKYSMPSIIGYGLQSRISAKQFDVFESAQKVEEMTPEQRDEYDKHFEYRWKIWTIKDVYNVTLSILEEMLTPLEGSPEVKDILEIAPGEEVAQFVNFFNGKLPLNVLVPEESSEVLPVATTSETAEVPMTA